MILPQAQTESAPTTVYIVEEQEFYRDAFRNTFAANTDFAILGVSGREGIGRICQIADNFKPDILLIGVKTLNSDLVKDLIKILKGRDHSGIVLLAMNINPALMDLLYSTAIEAEHTSLAFFYKQSVDGSDQLLHIIAKVKNREIMLDREVKALLEKVARRDFLKELTAREMEILSLLAAGESNATIAEALYIDVKTVKRHINSMYGKLNISSDERKHPRVSATRLYLEENGFLNK